MLINTKNDDLIEWPEMAKNAMGGTEAMVRRIYERLPRELLKEVQIVPTRMSKPLDPKRIRIMWAHDLVHDPAFSYLKDGVILSFIISSFRRIGPCNSSLEFISCRGRNVRLYVME